MAKKVIAMSVDLSVDYQVDFSLLPDELSHLVFEIAGVDIPEFVLKDMVLGVKARPGVGDVLFDLARSLEDRLAEVYPCLSLYMVTTLEVYLNSRSDNDIEVSLRDKVVHDVFGALLVGKMDQLAVDAWGQTQLHSWVCSGDGALLALCLMAGADPTVGVIKGPNRGQTPLHFAVRSGSLDLVDLILTYCDDPDQLLACVDAAERSVFHFAARLNTPDILDRLLASSSCPAVDINAEDETGFTPLHYAVCSGVGSVGVTALLLEHGADSSLADQDGYSPLHLGVLGLMWFGSAL